MSRFKTCVFEITLAVAIALSVSRPSAAQVPPKAEVHDSHFHLTDYIQKGLEIRDFVKLMGDKVGRVALFGIPLQQTWHYPNSGSFAPRYYTESDAPLYYYSFTDSGVVA